MNSKALDDSLEWVDESAHEPAAPPAGEAAPLSERSRAATQEQPGNLDAWVARAELATTTDEKLFCLSQVSRLDPTHAWGRAQMHRALWNELRRDSFLAYLEETDRIYFIRNRDFTSIAIPKDRSPTETFPATEITDVRVARSRLGWAVAGLVLSGLGTIILAPLAIQAAARALRGSNDDRERRQAWIVIGLSLLLMPLALFLTWILAIHF